MRRDVPDHLEPLAVLAEPVRRRLYEFVVAHDGAVDRDAAAAGVGIGRPLAAFHLDRLAAAGLVDVEYRRRTGRTGPGAGRPAKYYRRAGEREFNVSLPPRQYDLAAAILADGIEREGAIGGVLDAARAMGGHLADGAAGSAGREALLGLLADNGYEPVVDADGVVRLRNCPFHALVADHLQLTCSMNLEMLGAATDGIADTGLRAVARPATGWCCVAFVPDKDAE